VAELYPVRPTYLFEQEPNKYSIKKTRHGKQQHKFLYAVTAFHMSSII